MANKNEFNFDPDMSGFGDMIGQWGSYFGYKNPAKQGMNYLNQSAAEQQGYYEPYMRHGEEMYGPMSQQYNALMNDPGGRMNQIGQSYQQSPGFKFALQQALQGSGAAQAAGGMAGTPQHEQQNMQLATNMANQDYNQWLQQALGQYDVGLGGAQNVYGIGANSANSLANNMRNIRQDQSELGYKQGQYDNAHNSDLWSGIGKVATGILNWL